MQEIKYVKVDMDAKFSKMLIRIRLDMEDDFVSGMKRKSELWDKVLEKMKQKIPNLTQTKEQINRKFLNLFATYKRIKTRKSGKNTTLGEFFDDFEEVYADRLFNNPPTEELDESTDSNYSESCDDPPESPASSEPQPKRRKRGDKNDILQFLEEESLKEQKRHEEVLAMEERKLLMEEKRINAMQELKETLEKAFGN